MKLPFLIHIPLRLLGLLIVAGLSACGVGPTNPASAPPAPTVTGRPTTSVPTLGLTPGTSSVTITMKENGRHVLLKSGQTILLALDTVLYDHWTIIVGDSSILTALTNVTLPPNAQGIYQAGKPGQTLLKAMGDLKCRKGTPPCKIIPQPFQIQVTVE